MTIVGPAVGDTITAAWGDSVADALNGGGWVVPTLGNSWVSFDAGTTYDIPAYQIRAGVVYFKGVMKSGTTSTAVFTLPTGFRPLLKRGFAVWSNTGQARVEIFSTGVVQVLAYEGGGSNVSVFLDGIAFPAEQ